MSSTCLYWLPHPPQKKKYLYIYIYMILIELMFLLFFLMISSTFLATNVCEKSASFWHLRIAFGFFLRQEYHHCQPAGLCSKLFAFSSGDPKGAFVLTSESEVAGTITNCQGWCSWWRFSTRPPSCCCLSTLRRSAALCGGASVVGLYMKFWHAPQSELKVGLRSSGQHADIWVKTLFFGKLNGINLPFGMVFTTHSESCIILGMVFGVKLNFPT